MILLISLISCNKDEFPKYTLDLLYSFHNRTGKKWSALKYQLNL